MTSKNLRSSQPVASAAISLSEIAQIAGGAPLLLPGESEQAYLEGRQGAIEELGARTHLQVYLAEKIFDCLWWMRAYEAQKRATFIRSMVDDLMGASPMAREQRLAITQAITEGQWQQPNVAKLLLAKGLTPESLLQQAMASRPDYFGRLDELIALRAKLLVTLQTSYEALVNRRIVQERLKLQNDLLKRDLTAIEVAAVPAADQGPDGDTGDQVGKGDDQPRKSDDQPRKARG